MTLEQRKLRYYGFVLSKLFRILGRELGSTRGSA